MSKDKRTISSVLAEEGIVSQATNEIISETRRHLNDPNKFDGFDASFEPFMDANDLPKEITTPKSKEITLIAEDRLLYTCQQIAKAADLKITKEEGNKLHSVSLTHGTTHLGDFTMGSLLTIKSYLEKIKLLFTETKTLPTGTKWVPTDEPGKYKQAIDNVQTNSREVYRWVPVSPATQHHPEQVKEVKEKEIVGKTTTTYYNSLLPSQKKHLLLKNVDALLISIGNAIAEFNTNTVPEVHMFDKIVDILFQTQQ